MSTDLGFFVNRFRFLSTDFVFSENCQQISFFQPLSRGGPGSVRQISPKSVDNFLFSVDRFPPNLSTDFPPNLSTDFPPGIARSEWSRGPKPRVESWGLGPRPRPAGGGGLDPGGRAVGLSPVLPGPGLGSNVRRTDPYVWLGAPMGPSSVPHGVVMGPSPWLPGGLGGSGFPGGPVRGEDEGPRGV